MSILYKSARLGKDGRVFQLLKFRTMVKNADRIGGSSTADDDPRITKIGKLLRKTKLDELPQIINLLKGDMTLIGWRPEVPQYKDTIHPEVLATKPGIIGLATLWDFDEGARLKGSSDPDRDYELLIMPMKRELELEYVRRKSFKLDCWVIWRTFLGLLGMRLKV
jgi:lipopolysaccharide/colanic/teichoic acid biosynthesis glycosyltransferase